MVEDCDGPTAQVTLGASVDADSSIQTLDSKSFENPLPPASQGMTDKELAIIVSIASAFLLLIALIIRLYENR